MTGKCLGDAWTLTSLIVKIDESPGYLGARWTQTLANQINKYG